MEDSMKGFVALKINDLHFFIYWFKFSEDYKDRKQASVYNSYKLSWELVCIEYIYVCLCSY